MYYIIDPKCANKVYTNEDFDVELLQFKTKESAEYYLEHGKIMKKINDNDEILVFTDGSCSNNGFSNAKAGIGIYFSEDDPKNVSKKIEGKQTNNTAELSAIIEVFKICSKDIEDGKKIIIHSDSTYSIQCCGEYGEKCSKKGWKNKKGYIPNHELVKTAYELFNNNKNVEIKHIKAHTGMSDKLSIGNEGADRLAYLAIN
tara:strand:- start:8251 stop:8853 length:603 start_codon:yes stop_codon:yes gene_type:complete